MSNNSFIILDDFVKILVRSFYPDEYVVVIEGLLREKRRIKDDDLAIKLNLKQREVRKYLSDLRNDSVLKSSDVRIEATRPGERASTQTLWYLDYKHIIDVVKYKLHHIRQKMEAEKSTKIDVQSYKCIGCLKIFTALDISPNMINPQTGELNCDSCSCPLTEEHNNESLTETTKHHSDLLGQLKKLIDQLRRTEDIPQIPVFARELAEGAPDGSQSFTINTGSASAFNQPKSSAFTTSTTATTQANANPVMNQGDIELVVDIYDSDNIDEMNKAEVKKDTKKTGLASLPPWLLPSNSILNKSRKSSFADKSNQNKEAIKQEKPIKIEVFDQKLYEDYIKSHYKEWDSVSHKRIKLSEDTNGNGGTPPPPLQSEENKEIVQMEVDYNNFIKSVDTNDIPMEDMMVKIGDRYIHIDDVTEEDKESMTAQEYEDFQSQLYIYASKSYFSHSQDQ